MHISIIAVERSCGLKVFHLWLLSYLVQFFFMIPDIFFIFWYWSLHMQIVSWSTQDFTPRNHFATATWSTTEKRIKRLNFPANSYLFCKQNNAFPLLILNAIFSFVSWENLEFLLKFSRAFVDLNQLSINTLSSFFFKSYLTILSAAFKLQFWNFCWENFVKKRQFQKCGRNLFRDDEKTIYIPFMQQQQVSIKAINATKKIT